MSQRDEEIIGRLRRGYEALSHADFDAATELLDPEFELVRVGGQSSITGARALRRWMEPDAFEQLVVEPRDFRVNGTKVLVRQHVTARGAGSGIEVDIDGWGVWTTNDGGIPTRLEIYLPHQEAEALEAAGLRE